ncbi:hypothetical protein VWY03_04965 [Phaeobacter sp. JH20_09]|uniref:hypothetical protein n=1 Tax=unclassified Phaeobacter TaxID=2621772 RepID=UPI003A8C76D3
MPKQNDSDRKTLAFELLGMTYGETMAFAGCLSDILVNNDVDVSEPDQLAIALHSWAKAENEKSE